MAYKKKEKVSLLLYYDYIEQFECLTDEQLRKLIYAMIEFDKNEKEIELDKVTKMAFIPIRKRLKLDKENWIHTCKTNSENAKKRWNNENATVYDCMPKNANYADIERDIEKEKEKEIEKECVCNSKVSSNSSSNTHPTLADIISFCSDNNIENFDCEYFYDYYEANGWVDMNKKKKKNWKSKIKTWYKKDSKNEEIKQNKSKKKVEIIDGIRYEDGRRIL